MRRPRITERAQREVRALLNISRMNFGPAAARRYQALIQRAYKLLAADPQRPGVQRHDDLPGAPFFFHLRHARPRGGGAPKQPRHFIVFAFDDTTLTILRVLHEAMDVERRGGEADN